MDVKASHEAKCIRQIVETISLELRSINVHVDKNLVGMEARVYNIVSSLQTASSADVCMIGIKGIGGGGKTTLAIAVFDKIFFEFEGKSFIDKVREVSNASSSGLKVLQSQILSNVLINHGIHEGSVSEGKNMTSSMMGGTKMLLVLDGVDNVDHLEALAGDHSWRAFGKEIPTQGYEELSRHVVRYVDGLPLTIKVLGSFLCCKNKLEWEETLAKLEIIPLKETQKVLELSYTSLEDDYKEMFLDVATILKGWVLKQQDVYNFTRGNSTKRSMKGLRKMKELRFLEVETIELELTQNLNSLEPTMCHYLEELLMPYRYLNFRHLQVTWSKLRTLDIGLSPDLNSLELINYDGAILIGSFEVSSSAELHFTLERYPFHPDKDLQNFESTPIPKEDYAQSTCSTSNQIPINPNAKSFLSHKRFWAFIIIDLGYPKVYALPPPPSPPPPPPPPPPP
ncbi:hypothetical protein LXL04_012829 [Taraxacum kok-saghyz]